MLRQIPAPWLFLENRCFSKKQQQSIKFQSHLDCKFQIVANLSAVAMSSYECVGGYIHIPSYSKWEGLREDTIWVYTLHTLFSNDLFSNSTYFWTDRERTADTVSSMHANIPDSNCIKGNTAIRAKYGWQSFVRLTGNLTQEFNTESLTCSTCCSRTDCRSLMSSTVKHVI